MKEFQTWSSHHVCANLCDVGAAAAAAAAAQVTKEDIEAEKARLAAIDARPIKKVAEAKARKQKRLQVGGWHCAQDHVSISSLRLRTTPPSPLTLL
jgi:hypothetical protein